MYPPSSWCRRQCLWAEIGYSLRRVDWGLKDKFNRVSGLIKYRISLTVVISMIIIVVNGSNSDGGGGDIVFYSSIFIGDEGRGEGGSVMAW